MIAWNVVQKKNYLLIDIYCNLFTICRISNLISFETNIQIEYVPAIIFVFEFGYLGTSS